MDYGKPIDEYLELIQIDYDYNIYISRRSLKHFVESRKNEMFNKHAKDEILNKLYFAIDSIINVYVNYDEYKINDLNRLIYTKYFESIKSVNLRIILENKDQKLEICSIHFQKHK